MMKLYPSEYLLAVAVFIALLSLSECVGADNWSKADKTRQMIYTALLGADALMTIQISNEDDIEEKGYLASKVLGSNPEPVDTVGYFTALAVVNYYAARSLPPGRWRSGFQTLSSLSAGTYVINNWNIGLRPVIGR